MMSALKIILLLVLTLLFSACVPKTTLQKPLQKLDIQEDVDAFTLFEDKKLRVDWWRDYGDTQLNTLIDFARGESVTIKSLDAKFAQANNLIRAIASAQMPTISADGSITRERFSENYIFPPPLGGASESLYQAGVGLSYDFDFWHARDYKILSAKYSALAQKAAIEEMRLVLSSAICELYLSWNYDEKRVEAEQTLSNLLKQEKNIMQKSYQSGLSDTMALNELSLSIVKIERQIQTIKRAIETKKASIAILAGLMPSKIKEFKTPKIDEKFQVPLPKEIYLDLLSHRADISVQKYKVLSKAQNIELAKTAFYPNVSLSAMVGVVSFDLDKFLGHSSYAPSAGVAFSLPLFDGDKRKANLALHVSDYNSSVNEYDKVLIKAANEVVSTLKKTQILADEIALHVKESSTMALNEKIAQKRFQAGIYNKRELLHVRMQMVGQDFEKIELQENRAYLQVELIKALGGGYVDKNASK